MMVFSFLKRQKKIKKGQCSPLYTGNQVHVDNYRNILLLLYYLHSIMVVGNCFRGDSVAADSHGKLCLWKCEGN